MKAEEKEWRIRPYYKSELAEAYAPELAPGSALNRLALWIKTNTQLTEALAKLSNQSTNVYIQAGSTYLRVFRGALTFFLNAPTFWSKRLGVLKKRRGVSIRP